MGQPLEQDNFEQVQPIDLRSVARLDPSAIPVRLSALDLTRGIAILLMVISHSIKGLLTFEQMPAWGIMPVHTITKLSSSMFFLVFGISLSLFFLPYVGTSEWKAKRNKLLWRSVQLMIAYKVLTVVQMYMTYDWDIIIETLLFYRFPDFVEVLGFYSICLIWIPFFLPYWKNMPVFSKLGLTLGLAIAGFVLNQTWDFGGYTSIKAILVEESGHFTFGQFQRGAVVLLGMILGDLFNTLRGDVRRERYMGLILLSLGTLCLSYFYSTNEHDLYNVLFEIGKNQGKHPPSVTFMAFSLGGALFVLGSVFLAGRWLPKFLMPITVVGQAPLWSFCFHIVIVFVFFRDIYGLHHKTDYNMAWFMTGFLVAMTIASAAAVVRVMNDGKKKKAKARRAAVTAFIFLFAFSARAQEIATVPWNQKLQSRMVSVSKAFDGEVGLYVKDLETGISYSMNADTQWYLASSIKLFVLIEVLQKIEKGDLGFTDPVKIEKSHYRDGSGQTNWVEPGQSVSLRFLIEQMMIESDNAATDIIIGLIGLDDLNKTVANLAPGGFSPFTSLLTVRHQVFSEFHPAAKDLSNMDFITIKKVKDDTLKVKKFAELIGVETPALKAHTQTDAFEKYYEKGLNSGSLISYAQVLEKIAKGQVISESRSREILELMRRCYTGKDRIISGLSKKLKFAHKTGTQYRRACDMGVVTYADSGKNKKAVVVACTQKFRSPAASTEVFRKIGEAITDSGLMP